MISNGSYEISTFSTTMKGETRRLDAQIDLFWPEELRFYKSCGIGYNSHIVDLGCGTGYLIQKLSQAFPTSKFVGVEQDQFLFDSACDRLQNNPSVNEIIHNSIEGFSQSDNNFDFAIMRLVLEHIPNPVNILLKIRSMLKSDGKLIIIDNDFDYHLCTYPSIDELDLLYDAYKRSRINDGGDPCIGRKLPQLLSFAGFNNITFNIIHAHSFLSGENIFLSAEGAGIPAKLAEKGFLDNDTFNKIVIKWSNMLKSPDHILFRQLFAVCGNLSAFSETPNSISGQTALSEKSLTSNDALSLKDYIIQLFADTLNISPAEIDLEQPIIDTGCDSIEALNIQIGINKKYNIEINISELLGGKSISDIISHIENRLCSTNLISTEKKTFKNESDSGVL